MPPLYELLEYTECLFRGNVPLVRRADLFEFLHNLLLIPGLDLIHDIPYENGVTNGVVSGSEVENQGYDFVINVIPVRLKDVTWQLSLNTSVTRNSVTKNERLNTLYNYLDGSGVWKDVLSLRFILTNLTS